MPTTEQLLAKATRYLASYAASRVRLRQILQRYAAKFNQGDDKEGDGGVVARIDTVLDRCQTLGWLDDHRFAASRARRLLAQGHPPKVVAGKLVKLGIGRVVGRAVMSELDGQGDEAELRAAIGLARRRRLGPWSTGAVDAAGRRKQLAVLARAGFSGRVARRVVGARSVEELIDGDEEG